MARKQRCPKCGELTDSMIREPSGAEIMCKGCWVTGMSEPKLSHSSHMIPRDSYTRIVQAFEETAG